MTRTEGRKREFSRMRTKNVGSAAIETGVVIAVIEVMQLIRIRVIASITGTKGLNSSDEIIVPIGRAIRTRKKQAPQPPPSRNATRRRRGRRKNIPTRERKVSMTKARRWKGLRKMRKR